MKNFTYDDELYHYGVKGMKWHKGKNPNNHTGKNPEGSFDKLTPNSPREHSNRFALTNYRNRNAKKPKKKRSWDPYRVRTLGLRKLQKQRRKGPWYSVLDEM